MPEMRKARQRRIRVLSLLRRGAQKGGKDRRRDGYDDLDPYDAYDDYDDWEEEEEKSGKTSNAEVLIGTFLALALLVAWATNNFFISLGLFFLVIIVSMIGSLPH